MESLGREGPQGGTEKPAVDLSIESTYVCSPYSSSIIPAIVTVRIEKNMKDPMK